MVDQLLQRSLLNTAPDDARSLCKLAEIKSYLCLNGIFLNGKTVEVGEVISIFSIDPVMRMHLYIRRVFYKMP